MRDGRLGGQQVNERPGNGSCQESEQGAASSHARRIVCKAKSPTTAAVSVRNTWEFKSTGTAPARTKVSRSAGDQPPSGPTIRVRALGTQTGISSRRNVQGRTRSPLSGNSPGTTPKRICPVPGATATNRGDVVSSNSGSQARPLCFRAEIMIVFQRSRLPEPGAIVPRSVSSGIT